MSWQLNAVAQVPAKSRCHPASLDSPVERSSLRTESTSISISLRRYFRISACACRIAVSASVGLDEEPRARQRLILRITLSRSDSLKWLTLDSIAWLWDISDSPVTVLQKAERKHPYSHGWQGVFAPCAG